MATLALFAISTESAGAESFATIYESERSSVVYIVAALPNGAASGSGFIYSSTGSTSTVVTANHVVEGASRVDVVLDSDPHHRYPATIVKRDHVRDVAILTIPIGNRKALPLMDPQKIREGSEMAVIGYPRATKRFEQILGDDLRPSVHVGIISAIRLKGEIIQYDAPTDHGDSGGPVIDKATGAVIAIVHGALLDPSYAARGLEQALPGSNYGMSVATIESVLNGSSSAGSVASNSMPQSAASTATSPGTAVASAGGSSAAYRVGYGAPHYTNAEVETDSQLVLQRLASYFSTQNTFYMVPVSFGTVTENGQKISGVCDDERLNAIVQPAISWNFPRVYLATGAPESVAVKVSLVVTDCSGGAFFYVVKTQTEGRKFSHRTVDRQIVDIANDLLDQTLKDFETFRATHAAAWDSLLKTGIAIDPNDGRYHTLFNFNFLPDTHKVHVYAVFTNGPAAKGGLQVGDIIETVNGQIVTGMTASQIIDLFNVTKVELTVSRPGGQATLTIVPEKTQDLLSSLGR